MKTGVMRLVVAMVLLAALFPWAPEALAYSPPYNDSDVTVTTETIPGTDLVRVRHTIHDPVRNQDMTDTSQAYEEILTDSLGVKTGIVFFTGKVGGNYHVYTSVYDPAQGQWKTSISVKMAQDSNYIPMPKPEVVVDCGIAAFSMINQDLHLIVNDHIFYAKTYDPGIGSWQEFSKTASRPFTPIVKDGIVAYREVWYWAELPMFPYTNVGMGVYDPRCATPIGLNPVAQKKVDLSNESDGSNNSPGWRFYEHCDEGELPVWIDEATVKCLKDDTELSWGYVDWGLRQWMAFLPTTPVPLFVAQPTVGPPPLKVWFTDMSIGCTSLTWYPDGRAGSFLYQRSFHRTYNSPGTYQVFQDGANAKSTDPQSTSQEIKVQDVTPPAGSILINGGATYTNSRGVTLSVDVSGGDPGSQMRFAHGGSEWGPWQLLGASAWWNLEAGDGQKWVWCQFKDGAGNLSTPNSAGIILDTTLPTISFSIDGGATATRIPEVILNLSAWDCNGPVSMCFGEFVQDPMTHSWTWPPTWTEWEVFNPSKWWTLSNGDGDKIVGVMFQDAAGNIASTNKLITLDTTSPSYGLSINGGAAWANSTAVTLNISGSGGTMMRFVNGDYTGPDPDSWPQWEPIAATKAWTLWEGENGDAYVWAQFRDAAGNIFLASARIGLDTFAPGATMTINGGAQYTNTPAVTLYPEPDDGEGSGAAFMRFSNTGVFGDSDPWEPLAATKAWTLTSGNGPKQVWAQFGDNAGNVSACSAAITLDSTRPAGFSISLNNGATYTNRTDGHVGVRVDAGGQNTKGMQMAFGNLFSSHEIIWGPWEAYSAKTETTVPIDGDGIKTKYARFKDAAGNISNAVSDTIILDTAAPAGSISINGGAQFTKTTAVAIIPSVNADLSNVRKVGLSNDGSVFTEFLYSNPLPWTLALGNGPKTVYAKFTDGAGNTSPVVTAAITLDTVAPLGFITINDGAQYTKSLNVLVNPLLLTDVSGPDKVLLGHNPEELTEFTYTGQALPWTLTAGDGDKTVYAKFIDKAGNRSAAAVNASITLDTHAPEGSVSINEGAQLTCSTQVVLSLQAGDGGKDMDTVCFSNDGSTFSTPQPYAAEAKWTLSAGANGLRTVRAKFADRAGNTFVASDTITLDDIPPSDGSISINAGAVYTKIISVNLTLSATGATKMCFSTDNSTWSQDEAYATAKVFNLSGNDGQNWVYVKYKDDAGNGSVSGDSIILDTTPPIDGTLTAASGTGKVTLNWSGFSDATSGLKSYVLYFSDKGYPSAGDVKLFEGLAQTYTHNVATKGANYYRLVAVDDAGNVSAGATVVAKKGALLPFLDLLLGDEVGKLKESRVSN